MQSWNNSLQNKKNQLSPRKFPELKSPDRKEEQECPQLLATSCWIRAWPGCKVSRKGTPSLRGTSAYLWVLQPGQETSENWARKPLDSAGSRRVLLDWKRWHGWMWDHLQQNSHNSRSIQDFQRTPTHWNRQRLQRKRKRKIMIVKHHHQISITVFLSTLGMTSRDSDIHLFIYAST